jgi:transcriptional regulator with XRE-family HTH domain
MPRKIIADADSRARIAALRAKGLTLQAIGNLFGVSRQGIRRILQTDPRHKRIRCQACDCRVNAAGALLRDDRQVFCLHCLAASPDATFGEHLQAYRLAAGLRIVALAKLAGVDPSHISAYEEGRVESAAWPIQKRLFQTLGVDLVMHPAANLHRAAGVEPLMSHSSKATRQKRKQSA